jgi:hypothetical protein
LTNAMGDGFAQNAPLPFKGEDFPQTDVKDG